MKNPSFGYFWTEKLCERVPGVLCPEVPKRCEALRPTQVFKPTSEVTLVDFDPHDSSILSLVHTSEYIEFVRSAFHNNVRALDAGDTRVTENTFEQALLAASAGCHAVDHFKKGTLRNAFCAVRPPGHHANSVRASGFCIFNNVAIAARYAQHTLNLSRVLIVDWDVHPGNGTQEIFWEDSSVFVLSFHEAGLLGSCGTEDHIGANQGEGMNRNVPFAPETSAAIYINTFESVVANVVQTFQPELLLISAGFDAHQRDQAAKQTLAESDYARMTHFLLEFTYPYTAGKTLSILEGGYNVSSLKSSVTAHCKAMSAFRH